MKFVTSLISSVLLFFILVMTVLIAQKGGLGTLNSRASANATVVRPMLFVGDSVGAGAKTKLLSAFGSAYPVGLYDAAVCRAVAFATKCFGKSASSGLAVARTAPRYSYAVVELGYNDTTKTFRTTVDNMMNVLVSRGYQKVIWINVSERLLGGRNYKETNQKLLEAKAQWPQLIVLDWNSASSGSAKDGWFVDSIHLTANGSEEFAKWLRVEMDALQSRGLLPTYVPTPTSVYKNYGQGTGKCRATFGYKATCMNTAFCNGTIKTGYCPGPSTWKCCVRR